MSENIQIIEQINADESVSVWVQIDRGNGEFTSMPKSVYDEQQANADKGTIS